MFKTLLSSKIHRAKVTQADLDYVGSISVDKDLLEATGLVENEQVQVLNISNGNRLTTYVIEAPAGSGMICINGAAAHLMNVGDLVIICSYAQIEQSQIKDHKPKIALVDGNNRVLKMLDKQEAQTKYAELV